MKFFPSLLGAFFIFTLSGCGILLKKRQTNHHGIEKNDFDLPVITYPSATPFSKKILFLFSGDGGWVDFEDQLATEFSKRGFFIVGFNSRTYFWEKKTPQQTADDVLLLIKKYSLQYKANRIYLCGYSFGADIVPFIYNRLPLEIKMNVEALQMLSPFATSDFMVHTSDLLNIAQDNNPYKVQPEVESITAPIFCFYGTEESPKPLQGIKMNNFSLSIVPGGHKYTPESYGRIVNSFRPVRRFFQNQFFK